MLLQVRRCDITQHIQSASVDHLGLACFKIIKMDEEQKKLIQTTKKLEEKLKDCHKENDKLQDSKRTLEAKTRKLEENLNYALNEQNQLKRKLEENLNYALDGQNQFRRKLEQDTSSIKTQLNTSVNRSATVTLIEDHLNRAKDDVRRELNTVKSDLLREIDTLHKKISSVENNLHRKVDDAVERLRRDINDDVDQKLRRFGELLAVSQGAYRPSTAPQTSAVPGGVPCTQFMYGWGPWGPCGPFW